MRYLLDSVIVIDHFNAIEPATGFLKEQGGECALSAITRAETLAGFDSETEPLATPRARTPRPVPHVIPHSRNRRYRRPPAKNPHLKLPDAFQAAVACQHDLILVTRNTRDFRPGGTPEVLIPYRL